MGRRRGSLLAEAVVALFFAFSFFIAATSTLTAAARQASRGILSIEAERRAEEFIAVLASGGADAALAASLFHFHELDIGDLKRDLAARGVPVRL